MAMVGLSEKGMAAIQLQINSTGGHSSTAPDHTAIGLLSEAVVNIERNPLPLKLDGPGRCLFEFLAPEAPFMFKLVLSNLWLFERLLLMVLSKDLTSRTSFMTTQSVTVFQSGNKFNVLPITATATLNYRIAPWHSISIVENHLRKTINNDDISISHIIEPLEPSPITSHDTAAYRMLEKTLRQVMASSHKTADGKEEPPLLPGMLVVPSLCVANTDTQHYWNLTENIFRINPIVLDRAAIKTIHGSNEKISKKNLIKMVEFYHELFRNSEELE